MKWSLVISKEINEKCKKTPFDPDNIIAINAFTDVDDTDTAALLVKEAKETCLYVLPGFKKIKCPCIEGVTIRSFNVNLWQILLLYQDGSIFRCLDWRIKNFFTALLPLRFTKLAITRIHRPLSLSVNFVDQICWSCDEEGYGWILRMKNPSLPSNASCRLARDDSFPSVRLKSVAVSPGNSGVVWASDSCGRVFVREGIFNEKGDEDNLITGINWVRVSDMPYSVKSIVACNDSVWILCEFSPGDILFKRKGINPPLNYIGSHWEKCQLPTTTTCFSSMTGKISPLIIIFLSHTNNYYSNLHR